MDDPEVITLVCPSEIIVSGSIVGGVFGNSLDPEEWYFSVPDDMAEGVAHANEWLQSVLDKLS